MKTSPFKVTKQKLSPSAAKKKAKRDLAYANGPYKKKRAENQKNRRSAIRKGKDLTGLDYDHRTSSFKSVKYNRGNNGRGTKLEGK
tara:strand:- start:211 stop:468 length:258 start_codon:yes stop_codon:yes gene_type:complete